MTLDCNHDCVNCPAHIGYIGKPTNCMIINGVLDKLDYDKRVAKQLYLNSVREGEKNDKNI